MSKHKLWEREEVQFLKQNYGRLPRADIAAAIGRTESAIVSKVISLGLRVPKKADINIEHVKRLKAEGRTLAEISAELNITRHQVNHCLYHSKKHGDVFTPRVSVRWTRENVALLVSLARSCTAVDEIARQLGCTPSALRVKASSIGLTLPNGRKSYTQQDIDLAYQMKEAGFALRTIASKLDDPPIPVHTVRRILQNETPSWELTGMKGAII